MYLDRVKEKRKKQRQKNREGTCTSGRELWSRKSFHTLGSPFTGGDGRWAGEKLQSHGGECSNKGAEGKAERFLHRGSVPTSTHQPEMLVCSPIGACGDWELRLGLQSSDPRERTGVGCVKTAWSGLVRHSWPGGSLGKSLDLLKRQETIVLGCMRRGDSFPVCQQKAEHSLNELQRLAWATAISLDPRDGHEMLRLLPLPPRILCESTGHYRYLPTPPHPPGACAACHCQGPMIQGQLPRENMWSVSAYCNIKPASATAGLPCNQPLL